MLIIIVVVCEFLFFEFFVCLVFSTRFECNFTFSPLVSSVVSHLLHSFRVEKFLRHVAIFGPVVSVYIVFFNSCIFERLSSDFFQIIVF